MEAGNGYTNRRVGVKEWVNSMGKARKEKAKGEWIGEKWERKSV